MSVVTYYPGYSQEQVHQNLIVQTILSITKANPAVLTTSVNHNYPAGVGVNFLIPPSFGMVELNPLNIEIIAVTPNTMTLALDTTHFTAFAYPSPLPSAYTPPSVIPNNSGAALPPTPLPYGNETSFEGSIYNNGVS